MLKRQRTIRSMLSHIPRFGTSLMPSYPVRHDPLFRGLFLAPSVGNYRSYPISSKSNRLEVNRTSTCNDGFRISRIGPSGLAVKSCFDSHKKNDQKARALAPHRQLLRDLEPGPREHPGGANLVNGFGACQNGSLAGISNSEKIVVAVDVDEVLGNFVSALNRFIADQYSLNHSVSDYHVYEFCKIWKCSRDEADIRVHEFFKSRFFKRGIHPLPGARQALRKLSRFCKLSVVTSRQNVIKDHTIEWIEQHFPGLFQEIHFGNHFALQGVSRPKSEICRALGAKVLIDDNPRYAVECAEVGMKVLLFDFENSYPWCKTESINGHPLVTKVHNWDEVEQQLVSWVLSQC